MGRTRFAAKGRSVRYYAIFESLLKEGNEMNQAPAKFYDESKRLLTETLRFIGGSDADEVRAYISAIETKPADEVALILESVADHLTEDQAENIREFLKAEGVQ